LLWEWGTNRGATTSYNSSIALQIDYRSFYSGLASVLFSASMPQFPEFSYMLFHFRMNDHIPYMCSCQNLHVSCLFWTILLHLVYVWLSPRIYIHAILLINWYISLDVCLDALTNIQRSLYCFLFFTVVHKGSEMWSKNDRKCKICLSTFFYVMCMVILLEGAHLLLGLQFNM